MSQEQGREKSAERGPRWAARSISRPVGELVQRRPFAARVLAVFERALDLVTPDGEVVALVSAEVGDGPLNVVVETGRRWQVGKLAGWQVSSGPHAEIEVGMLVLADAGYLQVGPAEVQMEGAEVWEPRPEWEVLRARREEVAAGLEELAGLAPPPLGEGRRRGSEGAGLASLRAGWGGDMSRLREAAAQLAGLGSGLTPAGDDLLGGAMLAAWLLHPDPPWFCQAVVQMAAPRTTTLSAALLRAAGRGECSAAWHRLLGELALGEGRGERLAAAVQAVLSYGATSGADGLAGFLWAAWQPGATD